MDIELAMSKVRGRKRRPGDAKRLGQLMRSIQQACEKDGPLKGMSKEEVLQAMRRTREEVWAETKDEAGTRR